MLWMILINQHSRYDRRAEWDMNKNIFEILTENVVNERMDKILLRDKEYQKVQKKINRFTEEFDKLGLPKEQRLIVDRLISSYTESGCCYRRIAYKQGIKDCTLLLRKMELIK